MSNLVYLTKSRGLIRTQVTKLHDKVQSGIDSMLLVEKKALMSKFEQYELKLDALDREVAEKSTVEKEDYDMETELELNSVYGTKIVDGIAKLKSSLSVPTNVSSTVSPPGVNKLKLPEIPLPSYSRSKGESLHTFLRSFESVLEKYQLTDYEKFIFLKRQIKGEPLTILGSLEESQQSYTCAKALLKEAFADETSQKFEAIRRLSDLRMTSKGNFYEFVTEMRLLFELFRNLKIDNDSIFQYFVWSGLHCGIQNQLVSMCNTNRPTFAQINDSIFKAIDRHKESTLHEKQIVNKTTESSSIASFAVGVSNAHDLPTRPPVNGNRKSDRTPFCSLCTERGGIKITTHNIRDCEKYPTVESKIRRLKSITGCTLCGYINHATNACAFKFNKPCFHCQGGHMSYLCSQKAVLTGGNASPIAGKFPNKNTSSRDQDKKQKSVSSGVVWTGEALQSQVGSNSILPTFTSSIGTELCVRCLKDSGCQPNFIEAKLAKEQNLPVIDSDFVVTINGFNGPQTYHTSVVQVELIINNKPYKLRAICVPEIKTKLILPGLCDIVHAFNSKGYVLADRLLTHCPNDEVSNIRFVLGTSDLDVLVERQVTFGASNPSIYSLTDAGVLLYGETGRILGNLSDLSDVSKPFCSSYNSQINDGESISLVKEACPNYDAVQFVRSTADGAAHAVLAATTKNSNMFDESNTSIVVVEDGHVNQFELERATEEILTEHWRKYLNYDQEYIKEESTEVNDKMVRVALEGSSRSDDGRIIMPLLWRGDVAHLLSTNYRLAKVILMSNLKKLRTKDEQLKMIDDVFREQEKSGVIERIDDLSAFLRDNPAHSFLAHMPVFKMDKTTSKCRVVFLSNLCEQNNNSKTLSHNQVMHAGPNLNQKITSALMQLRFDEKLLCYDLKKAFLQIALKDVDANRLLFLWFSDVNNGNYEIVAYRNIRLSFGLRCSPFILMISLYRILCVDSHSDSPEIASLKKLLYSLIYMDNGAVTGTADYVKWAYEMLNSVFNPYKFEVQQIVTNVEQVQSQVDTLDGSPCPETVTVLGMLWNRDNDTLANKPISLNPEANTKRKILKTIASHYDVFNLTGPCLNRARLFMHNLQLDRSLEWDTVISNVLFNEWRNIVAQANAALLPVLPRCVGNRVDKYKLLAFVDASKSIYAAVIYIKNLSTNQVSFLAAKNRLVNSQLEVKSIPSLELQAVTLGVNLLMDVYGELAGNNCVHPINIDSMQLFTDSMITLHWINSYSQRLDKMRSVSIFVMNRLESIVRQCKIFTVKFSFVSTKVNPADCLSRAVSCKQLLKSNYVDGPDFVKEVIEDSPLDVMVPNPLAHAGPSTECTGAQAVVADNIVNNKADHLIPLDKFSSFEKLVLVHTNVRRFINNLKRSIKSVQPVKFKHLTIYSDDKLYSMSCLSIIATDQQIHFPQSFNFCKWKAHPLVPDFVTRLNLFLDEGVLKVKSKFDRWEINKESRFPILLSKDSLLTRLIVHGVHKRMAHSGVYNMLTRLRTEFWIEHFFSTVKKTIKECLHCRKVNGRTIKLNQNAYRESRAAPVAVPFRAIFIDHMGPFFVRHGDRKVKIWLLCVTCLWSRAVNLLICPDLTVKSFLRCFQVHVCQRGLPAKIFSDLGSQLVPGGQIISDFLKDADTQSYLAKNGIVYEGFEHYFKGNSALGSLVEVCVKQTKRLMFGAVRNLVLDYADYELLVAQTVQLLNARPVAFKEGLRDSNTVDVPSPITPELLISGRNLVVTNVVPALQEDPTEDPNDPEWKVNYGSTDRIRSEFAKLRGARSRLISQYNSEFARTLIEQAVDRRDRYKKVSHTKLQVGDLVALREEFLKSSHYPMAIVRKVFCNSKGEVTDIIAMKGGTRENVKRHVSSVIKLLSVTTANEDISSAGLENVESQPSSEPHTRRVILSRACKLNN